MPDSARLTADMRTADSNLDIRKIAKAYSSQPWWYDLRGFMILTLSYQSTIWFQVNFFARNIRKRHMEVAIGTGTLLKMILFFRKLLGRPKAEILGTDYSDMMLSGARRDFARWKSVRLRREDAANINADDGSFDSINIANAFHCFAAPRDVLKEVHRVLAPGGTLAMNVLLYPKGLRPLRRIAGAINTWGIRKGILVTPYDRDDVRKMVLDAGFELSEEHSGGNSYSIVARKGN